MFYISESGIGLLNSIVLYISESGIGLLNSLVLHIIDVNVLIFLDFSFRYDSVHQKYKRLKRYVAHNEILWHRVTLRNEFSALEYLIQR